MFTRFSRAKCFHVLLRFFPVILAGFLALCASPSRAQSFEPTLTVGAGVQTGYTHLQPEGGTATDSFQLNHFRLYFSGDITSYLSAMVNTEYDSSSNHIGVLDGAAQFHFTPKFNVWMGRFLPPSDRANMYGPFYANEWKVFTDGVQDGYPFISQGRDNGIMYWGDFKAGAAKIKISAGAFDGASATGKNSLLWAGRVQLDFWDPENGYYLNGTYYGDKNLLAIGGATQVQNYLTATTVDFLLERKIMNGGAFGIESEYSNYNRLGGYNGNYGKSQGGYGLVSVLFPKPIGVGKIQAIGKFASTQFTNGLVPVLDPSYRQKTTEVDLGYIMKQFDARLYAYGKVTTFNHVQTNFWDAGLGLQFQLSKQIMGVK